MAPSALATGSTAVCIKATQTWNGNHFVNKWRRHLQVGDGRKVGYPADVEEDDVEDAQDGSGQPDREEGDEREGQAPDESQGQRQESRQQAVDPVTRSGEEDERRAPDRVESVRCVRFRQNVFKVQLWVQKKIQLIISAQPG